MFAWDKKKVLVTGAGGFIGSHLTERLFELGAKVRAFVRYTSRSDEGFIKYFSEDLRKNIDIVYGDIRELETVVKAMDGVDIIFNLAALVGIPYSYIHPQEVIEANTIGTLNILMAARDAGIEKLVQTSTSEVYGTARYVPIKEEHPKQPQSPYSASKIAADAIALSFYHSFDLPVAVIRPFNTYGPRQSDRAVIPSIISQALTKDRLTLGNTTPTRDFTFVTDTAEGFIKVAESEKSVGMEINVGSGQEISIEDLIKKIISLVGRDIVVERDKERIRPSHSEVERLCADNTNARNLLGWLPKISLTQGLEKTISFIKSNPGFYDPDKYRV
ncbi:MAG: SDR family NAD(P)-dependent oxidoreductase [Planctomycetes bacterium]|nr:SDR family NAD(P)-dependent oxidoreductase [Planctomycetota bacterium]